MFVFSFVFCIGFVAGVAVCFLGWFCALFLISEVDRVYAIDHHGSSVGESHHG